MINNLKGPAENINACLHYQIENSNAEITSIMKQTANFISEHQARKN